MIRSRGIIVEKETAGGGAPKGTAPDEGFTDDSTGGTRVYDGGASEDTAISPIVTVEVEGHSGTVPLDQPVGRTIRDLMRSVGYPEEQVRRVSREHIAFTRRDRELYVRDAGSTGGTEVHGRGAPVDEYRRIEPGEKLELADTVFVEILG